MIRIRPPISVSVGAPVFETVSRRADLPGLGGILARIFAPKAEKTAPKAATPTAPPDWYTLSSSRLDTAMNTAVDETSKHGYASFAEDVFYLDRLVERLRAWEKNILQRADAVRARRPLE